jgi:hypothetical protein
VRDLQRFELAGVLAEAASVGEKFSTRLPSRIAMRPMASAAL